MGDINRNALTIGTATITIKVIQVSGHKMTKATWRQITISDWNEVSYQLLSDIDVLGWVRDGDDSDTNIWLLWTDNGSLYRGWKEVDCTHLVQATKAQKKWETEFPQLFIAT